ncbi:putative Formamidopyrimidine-DNA glycosylase [Glarea lozoyensis 74030]|nr:putative Formamidopyrimidine-DNA glycosylase [Glarea lozoyensis 74030]
MRKKHVPIKALLLDQANISGIGNWVGDEVLYHAKFHPEQYSDTFSTEQIQKLHSSIYYVCSTAIDALADSSKFPDDWLFKHRWGKGKKDSTNTLPNGAKITHITVGGRTSAIVPSVQKKTGPVAGDLKKEDAGSDGEEGAKKTKAKRATKSKKAAAKEENEDYESALEKEMPKPSVSKTKAKSAAAKKPTKGKKAAVKEESEDEASAVEEEKPKPNVSKKRKAAVVDEEEVKTEEPSGVKGKKTKSTPAVKDEPADDTATTGRRRSGRVKK